MADRNRDRSRAKRRAPRPARPRGKAVVDAVLDATRAELAEGGFSALSVERVAERAGVNKTTVYRRYPTKIDLVQGALEAQRPDIALEDRGNMRDDLLNLVAQAGQFMCNKLGKSLFHALLADHGDPELDELVRRMREDGERQPRLLLQRFIARGELSPAADMGVLLNALFGPIVHRVLCEGRPFDRHEAEQLVDVWIGGMSVGAGQRARSSRRRARR